MNEIERLFRLASEDVCCNTSYPISPDYFSAYQVRGYDIMMGVGALAFYVHVPFCRSLCRFCEYTRVRSGDPRQESRYVDLLARQVEQWTAAHAYSRAWGLDVGGGTPTALNAPDFSRVMKLTASLAKTCQDPQF